MFEPIETLIKAVFPEFANRSSDELPNSRVLNKLLKQNNLNHRSLRFVTQDDAMPFPELGYEQRVYQHGLIATRKTNWHDFFNALIWLKFPKAKAAINAMHYQEIQSQNSSLRSKRRDLLTLFDECGVIIIANEKIQQLIQQHQWQCLFVENKNLWLNGEIKTITFGHAMYEKYLNPYIGMTAKALFLTADNINNLDEWLAANILKNQILVSNQELMPLPVLGIPNWSPVQDANFYNNSDYFR